jgi:hypothetical protein
MIVTMNLVIATTGGGNLSLNAVVQVALIAQRSCNHATVQTSNCLGLRFDGRRALLTLRNFREAIDAQKYPAFAFGTVICVSFFTSRAGRISRGS